MRRNIIEDKCNIYRFALPETGHPRTIFNLTKDSPNIECSSQTDYHCFQYWNDEYLIVLKQQNTGNAGSYMIPEIDAVSSK